MSNKRITKEFKITTSKEVMARFERLLAMLHFNSHWGHSSCFGMWLDGDGADKFTVDPTPNDSLKNGVNLIGGVGLAVELATNNGFAGIFKAKKHSDWAVKDDRLYCNGEDWEERKEKLRKARMIDFGPEDME